MKAPRINQLSKRVDEIKVTHGHKEEYDLQAEVKKAKLLHETEEMTQNSTEKNRGIKFVNTQLAKDLKPNEPDDDGNLPIHYAAFHGQKKLVGKHSFRLLKILIMQTAKEGQLL